MIFLTVIGLLVASVPGAWLLAGGFFHMLFNDMGGNGSALSKLAGLGVMLGAGAYLHWLWSSFNPIRLTIG